MLAHGAYNAGEGRIRWAALRKIDNLHSATADFWYILQEGIILRHDDRGIYSVGEFHYSRYLHPVQCTRNRLVAHGICRFSAGATQSGPHPVIGAAHGKLLRESPAAEYADQFLD